MGACYDVDLKIKFKEPKLEKKAAGVMQKYIKEHDGKDTNFSLNTFAKENIGTDTFSDLLRIFTAGFAFWHPQYTVNGEWVEYYNGFDASYGWDRVMADMFEMIAPFLSDGSEMHICSDDGSGSYVTVDGKCV